MGMILSIWSNTFNIPLVTISKQSYLQHNDNYLYCTLSLIGWICNKELSFDQSSVRLELWPEHKQLTAISLIPLRDQQRWYSGNVLHYADDYIMIICNYSALAWECYLSLRCWKFRTVTNEINSLEWTPMSCLNMSLQFRTRINIL